MAKFKIEVDLDWLGSYEDGEVSLDDTLREEITSQIVDQAATRLNVSMEAQAKIVMEEKLKSFEADVDNKLTALMEEFFDEPRDITDKWGNVKRKGVTARQLLGEAADKFFTELVDDSGKTDTYNAKQTRIEYITKKAVNHDITWAVERAVKDAVDKVKDNVKNVATKQLGEKLAEIVGLEKVL